MSIYLKCFYLSIFLFLISSCYRVQQKSEPEFITLNQEHLKRYHQVRNTFFQVHLDEKLNRFHGAVAEWVGVDVQDDFQGVWEPKYHQIKFADGLVYAGLAMFYLSCDLQVQQNLGSQKEFDRTLLLLERVVDGVILCDEKTKNKRNGFMYRDIVDAVDSVEVHSDYLSYKKTDKELSQSQLAGLFIGFDQVLLQLSRHQYRGEAVERIRQKIIKQMQIISQYLIESEFNLKNDEGEFVARGKGAKVSSYVFLSLTNKWLEEKARFAIPKKLKINWYLGNAAAQSFYSLQAAYPGKNYSHKRTVAKTWRPFYFQMLSVCLYDTKEKLDKYDPAWVDWVKRYRNGMAVAFSLSKYRVAPGSLYHILNSQLKEMPDHMPNNFDLDHQGWNHDCRWIRLLIYKTDDEVSRDDHVKRVYNGLDYLMAFAALYEYESSLKP